MILEACCDDTRIKAGYVALPCSEPARQEKTGMSPGEKVTRVCRHLTGNSVPRNRCDRSLVDVLSAANVQFGPNGINTLFDSAVHADRTAPFARGFARPFAGRIHADLAAQSRDR